MARTVEEIRGQLEHEPEMAVSAEDARVLLARGDTLQQGLEAAHLRIAELETKAANPSGYETAQRLRTRREQSVG